MIFSKKTKNRIKINLSEDLLALFIKCKTSSEFVISYNNKPVNADYLTKAFLKARNESGYFTEMTSPPSFHEIRALSSHLQEKAGIATHETQVLLAHASEKMTEHYQERHEVVWQEVDKNVLGKFREFLKQEGKK